MKVIGPKAPKTAYWRSTSIPEALTLEDARTGQREQVPAAAVFVMVGAEPRTQWRRDLVKLNHRGLILTGRDVSPGAWPLPPSTPAVQDEPARRSRRWPPRSG
jgi:hypothetical protein